MDLRSTVKNNNRRVTFRIYEDVKLSYRKVDEQEVPQSEYELTKPFKHVFIVNSFDGMAQNTHWLDEDHDTLNVNLSASGMAFTCEEQLKQGDSLKIYMRLLPSMTLIEAYTKVVYCKNSNPYENQYPFMIGTDFAYMKYEDRQLLIEYLAKKKVQHLIAHSFIAALIVMVFLMPETLFGFLLDASHFIIEITLHMLHLGFEFIEYNLDHFIEHQFHTELHDTQVIVFYIIMAIASLLVYLLWVKLPAFCGRLKNRVISYCLRKKGSFFYYWGNQTLFEKLKLFSIGLAVITCYVTFGM